MSKYEPLAHHLAQRRDGQWAASFAQIEAVLGFALPDSARRFPAWWANQRNKAHVQTAAWRDVGWRTARLDLARECVEFRREADTPDAVVPVFRLDRALLDQVKAMTGLQDDEAVVQHALRAVLESAAATRLSRAGGSMPDFVAPARRRPAA